MVFREFEAVVNTTISTGLLPNDNKGVYFVLASADINATDGLCTRFCAWRNNITVQGRQVTMTQELGANTMFVCLFVLLLHSAR